MKSELLDSDDSRKPVQNPRSWLALAFIGSIALHLLILALTGRLFLSSELERNAKHDLRKYTTTQVEVDPKYFKSQVNVDSKKPVLLPTPADQVEKALNARDEQRSVTKVIEDMNGTGGSPPIQDVPRISDDPGLNIPESPGGIPMLPPSQVLEAKSLIHETALGEAPMPTVGLPNPNSAVNAGSSAGSHSDGMPGYEKLAEALKVPPAKVAETLMSGKTLKVDNRLMFDFDKAELKETAIPYLKEIVLLLDKNKDPNVKIKVDGFADSIGDATYNLKLSAARALAVKVWFVEHGKIADNRVVTRGLGAISMIVPR